MTRLRHRYAHAKRKRELSVYEKHLLKIARQNLNMPEAMIGVLGGPSHEEARRIIRELTGKEPRE